MRNWECIVEGEPTFVVRTQYWSDAKTFAARRFGDAFGKGFLEVKAGAESLKAHAELEYRGHDFGAVKGRKQWVRYRKGNGSWGPWEQVS